MWWTYGNQIYARLLRSFEERLPRKDTLGSEITLLSFNKSPVNVERNGIISQCLDFLEDIQP